mgnify:CR=1 FL=1
MKKTKLFQVVGQNRRGECTVCGSKDFDWDTQYNGIECKNCARKRVTPFFNALALVSVLAFVCFLIAPDRSNEQALALVLFSFTSLFGITWPFVWYFENIKSKKINAG